MKHQRVLMEAGVPEEIYRDEFRWIRFLEEAADYEMDWHPHCLSRDEAKVLHAFIVQEYGNEEHRGTLRLLEGEFDIKSTEG